MSRVIVAGLLAVLISIAATGVRVSALDEPAGHATPDTASLSADERAELATRRLTEVRRQVAATLGRPCPRVVASWEAWLDGVVSVAATLIAVGDMDGPLKRTGASLERLRAFDDAKGNALSQMSAADAAQRRIDECAASLGLTPPSMHELVERVYERANDEKQREEAALGLAAELYRPIKRP